jgi:3-keto-disaccharide hydrolase
MAAIVLMVMAACGGRASAQTSAATTAPTTQESIANIGSVPPPAAPLPPNMTRIFDGTSLDGWKQIPPDTWTVKNGVLASLGAARGVIYTAKEYDRYRVIFDVRHVSGKPDHRAGVLVFCDAASVTPAEGEKPTTTLNGIQFQVPNGGHWDYRIGKNNGGKELFTRIGDRKFDEHQWSRVEILVDPKTGTARMAVAQPPGSKAVEALTFKDETAGRKGPFALQMHNKGLFDEYANLAIEENPMDEDLITTKAQ